MLCLLYASASLAYMYVYHMCPQSPEKGFDSPRTGVGQLLATVGVVGITPFLPLGG